MLVQFSSGIIALAIILFFILWGFLALDKIVSHIQLIIAQKYVKLRMKYYAHKLKVNPSSIDLADKYRRAKNHFVIMSMQHFMSYLTEQYGCFEICPECKLPKEPNKRSCSNCGRIPEHKIINITENEDAL